MCSHFGADFFLVTVPPRCPALPAGARGTARLWPGGYPLRQMAGWSVYPLDGLIPK